ncbi:hypothetical protein EHV15_35325 [Paenibacillus oralis]|uniref:Uncharacterized protein n=1 Tax=Paenibacillus oralis TaxID=2490856 RepID=A0A3P3TA08_9BACL|nr:hypothetical protein [Paenibacillus oralis]RRJ54847.1 hypothetical protein EHV15_35325 [Paenibacillus oralis]
MEEVKWKSAQRIQKKYIENKEQKYYQVELGIQTVRPKKIIALSRSIDEDKLNRLREKVEKDGWKDISPETILLWKLPNGALIVNGEGNHRAYYSRIEGIKEIKATVSLIIDMSKLTKEQQDGIISSDNNYMIALQNYIDNDDDEKELIRLHNEAWKVRNDYLKALSLV